METSWFNLRCAAAELARVTGRSAIFDTPDGRIVVGAESIDVLLGCEATGSWEMLAEFDESGACVS